MTMASTSSQFKARLLRPAESDASDDWAFVVLPRESSAILPRRGRTSIDGTINGQRFQSLLEPDGQKSHWLKVDKKLLDAAGADFGDEAHFEIAPVEQEPEPQAPDDLLEALQASPEALATWRATTPVARLDWIHWITSAKQEKTRTKRINDACDMLASGKKRVCCFDPSGFYSKAFRAPRATE